MRFGFAVALLAAQLCGQPGGLVPPTDPVWAEYFHAWSLVGERPEEGIALLQGIVARHKDFHRAYETLALSYWDNHQTERGKEYFQSLAAADPANGLADYALGIMLDRDESQPTGSSFEHYARCLQEQPGAWPCYPGAVEAFADPHKQNVPERELRQFIPWDENRPESALLLGWLYTSQRRIDEALRVLEAALERVRGTDQPELEAALHMAIADAHRAASARATEPVLEHASAALKIYQQLGDPEGQLGESVRVAQAYAARGAAARASEVFKDMKVVVVTHSAGYKGPNTQELTEANRQKITANGGIILTTTHLFRGVSGAMLKQFNSQEIGVIIANTLRMLGQGMKVVIEISVMAADAGLVRVDEEIIAIAGSGRGADYAVVLTPVNSNDFFDLKVKEILCKPRF